MPRHLWFLVGSSKRGCSSQRSVIRPSPGATRVRCRPCCAISRGCTRPDVLRRGRARGRYLLLRLPWDLGWIRRAPGLPLARRTRALAGMALAFVLAGLIFGRLPISDPIPALPRCYRLALAAGLARVYERFGARVTVLAAVLRRQRRLHHCDCDESRNRLAEGSSSARTAARSFAALHGGLGDRRGPCALFPAGRGLSP
jgi:hypothetical protein